MLYGSTVLNKGSDIYSYNTDQTCKKPKIAEFLNIITI